MSAGFSKRSERVVFRGHVFNLAIGEFVTPADETIEREIVRHPGAVAVVAVDGDDVVLVRQYRAAIDEALLEIPAGKRDVADEPPELCATRELQEEIGMHPGRLEPLARFYNSVGFSDEDTIVFLGTDLHPVEAHAHGVEEEYMTVERVALDDVPALIENGELRDAKTIIGLLLALRRLGR
jgi:ADP-ribose pyrophosphatase